MDGGGYDVRVKLFVVVCLGPDLLLNSNINAHDDGNSIDIRYGAR